jgi:SAM-dependent methyltransferase
MVQPTSPPSHWLKHAQQWGSVKSPLRPCPEDLTLIEQAIARQFPARTELAGLMLGVTPELGARRWKPALDLLAVDNTLQMIRKVWPGDTRRRAVACGDWLRLPVRDACMDVALIDGGLPAISFPDAHRRLATELHRVLKRGGRFVARVFARPERTEQVDDVLTAVRERKIGSFHAFKWRLAMSLQGENVGRGVRVDDIWRLCDRHFGDHAPLERLTGWPIDEIRTIEAYRASAASYHFPTVGELCNVFADALHCTEQTLGTYELAERCPILVFERAPAK